MTTLNFVNVNPSDLSNAKRVKITTGAEKAVESIVSNIDLDISNDLLNTLKTMILLNRNKSEKIKLTALKVALKFLTKKTDLDERTIFMKMIKNIVNSSLVYETLNSDIGYILKDIIKDYSVIEENISENYFEKVSYYTIISEFLKGKLHECKTCGKWTPVTFCSPECAHYDDLSDLDMSSISEEEFKENHCI